MLVLTPLLGFLGRATGARSNTPEIEDTKVKLAGQIDLTLEPPFPVFNIFNAPLPAGNIPVESWIYSQEQTFAAATGLVIAFLGPGVWDIVWSLDLVEKGAISDSTSDLTLNLIDSLTGSTAILGHLTNKQGLDQSQNGKFRLTCTVDSSFSFSKVTTAGLGTGVNLALLKIFAIRVF